MWGKKSNANFDQGQNPKVVFCCYSVLFLHFLHTRGKFGNRGRIEGSERICYLKKITLHRRSGEPMAGGGSYTGITKSNKEAKKGGTQASPPPSLTW